MFVRQRAVTRQATRRPGMFNMKQLWPMKVKPPFPTPPPASLPTHQPSGIIKKEKKKKKAFWSQPAMWLFVKCVANVMINYPHVSHVMTDFTITPWRQACGATEQYGRNVAPEPDTCTAPQLPWTVRQEHGTRALHTCRAPQQPWYKPLSGHLPKSQRRWIYCNHSSKNTTKSEKRKAFLHVRLTSDWRPRTTVFPQGGRLVLWT